MILPCFTFLLTQSHSRLYTLVGPPGRTHVSLLMDISRPLSKSPRKSTTCTTMTSALSEKILTPRTTCLHDRPRHTHMTSITSQRLVVNHCLHPTSYVTLSKPLTSHPVCITTSDTLENFSDCRHQVKLSPMTLRLHQDFHSVSRLANITNTTAPGVRY